MERKKEKLEEALGHLSPEKISQAAEHKGKTKARLWLSAVAAVLVIAIFLSLPGQVQAQAIALSPGSQAVPRPERRLVGRQTDAYYDQLEAHLDQQDIYQEQAHNALATLGDFFSRGNEVFLSGNGNRLWSPMNAYMGLAALTELTHGQAQQELFDLLGGCNTDKLRQQTQALWEISYHNDGKEQLRLANSLWLDSRLSYDEGRLQELATHYYTSVYRGDLDSRKISRAMGQWVKQETDGFLTQDGNQTMTPETVLALMSTIYFQSKWSTEFWSSNNTEGLFHGTGGDETCTYMNRDKAQMYYYWGESFGAVRLSLKNGCSMWFFLPDPDKSPEQVLLDGEYWQVLTDHNGWEQSKYLYVNLTVPKFDVSTSLNLEDGLKAMGIEGIFNREQDSFGTTLTGDDPVWVDEMKQTTRVAIDEKGVTAGSYIEIKGAGAAQPPEDIIDFVLDRPFLFFITSDALPLFAGVVRGELG